jgi:choline dehydrogenase-like flavoprotein
MSESRRVELTDAVVIGSGYGGAIPAYHLAAGGARVVVLERGRKLSSVDFNQDMRLGGYSSYVDIVVGAGISVIAGNCVGGSSVVNFAASLRAPAFIFDRKGGLGQRLWPATVSRASLDRWYDRVEESLPVEKQTWNDVSYAGGLFAAVCARAGRTCNPVPVAVDRRKCTNCGWQFNGCRVDAKRSMLLNYLPAATACGARVRPQHEVQSIGRATTSGYRYQVRYTVLDDMGQPVSSDVIEAKVVVLAAGALATPVILQRSEASLGPMPFAVGKFFSGNGDRLYTAVMNEERVRDVLGLERPNGKAYEASFIGKSVGSMTYDFLDPTLAEFDRYSLQQIYFPALSNLLAMVGAQRPSWFGVDKKEMQRRWRSWLTVLAMTEDDNEGAFGPPPPSGSYTRLSADLAQNSLQYQPNQNTIRGWTAAETQLKRMMLGEGLASSVEGWTFDVLGVVSSHPLSSARMGGNVQTSALTDKHELRGYPGIFVTDASAVPGSLCVNPSLTIAALAERAVPGMVRSACEAAVPVRYGAPAPGGETAARDGVMSLPLVRAAVG